MAPYSVAFGAMLLSVALWEQTAWGWSALKTGPGDRARPAAGPDHVAAVRRPADRALRRRAGHHRRHLLLRRRTDLLGQLMIGLEPNAVAVVIGMVPTGIGVGLTFPTLMGVSASSLPPSSFATGSGVINMIRQARSPSAWRSSSPSSARRRSPAARVAAFHRGWWVMAAITALGLIPTFALIRPTRT